MINVTNLVKVFPSRKGLLGHDAVVALRGVSFAIPDGGAISFIGESGSGKTTIGRILTGLETPSAGEIWWDDVNITALPQRQRLRFLRKVQLIQQDPYQALNPARTIEQALKDPLTVIAREQHKGPQWVQQRINEVLQMVGIEPVSVLDKYPHMLSGGQRQRIVIARALTVEPKVLVADEAVSMIDVSLRLGVLKLLRDLRDQFGISLFFITHDVAAARYVGQDGQLFVIYKGMIIESGQTDEVITHPYHPYTQALLSAVPVLKGLEIPGPDRYIPLRADEDGEIQDTVCLYESRCPFAQDQCRQTRPLLQGDGHAHACHFPTVRRVVATARPEKP
ncbi:oligopeptide/dipeptide ABC transporter ATP-binding protein [Sulfobacillus thermosulfidooxidans]|uniref:oligopeptide/dipeptide ABC transporter ATP-binding protein n=1 Tax=Sulfobacillus thermosulfidooxidans TaxID=28034 RepID=UPI000370802A|nr:ABC transporter ATP-binding protein [Sulfobacillus thermosulfidooxidans]